MFDELINRLQNRRTLILGIGDPLRGDDGLGPELLRWLQGKAEFAVRAGVEGTLSQGARGFGLRHCRSIGLAKAGLQHVAPAAAITVYRISDWLGGVPCAVIGIRQQSF